ncbi:MAG: phage terminase large subunit family protein [Paracoccus sp. (in: a-proteobacteria)]|uniref:phage terminase large subunit family protein n=1 Tax=Paracoccus sp. TaxID=267 RepID=UPI0026DF3520|nr:terminase gpA endonuclease subunit [Paracoccus sp. (in: a-proteobacteria)]MDO5630529.1 phage terminase large subunit family protein [Paracoccus sp. (in: a-proteobacteria)]
MDDLIIGLRRDVFAAIKPPARLDLAEWVEKNVRLPATVAAQSGRFKLFPYQVEIARSMGNPAVERVSILKSARVGATQLMVAAIGHYALNDPAAQMVVMPSESDCRMLMTNIIEPTFAASPALRNALLEDVSGRDTMLSRHYPGGSLALVSGGSPKNLRARTVRTLWVDEVDGLALSAGDEGDPVALAIRRTMTYSNRLIVMASTPVDEETSRILRAYNEGDCRIYQVPCPECGEFHEIEWKDIQWPEGKPEAAYYVCPSCGCVTQETEKARMVAAGRWVATKPEVTGHHSYRLNSLVSTLPNAALGRLATEFVAAKRDPSLLKTWVNTVLGQAWRDDSEGLDESDLMARAEPFCLDRIPPEVLTITGGADIQRDRIELATLGWTADGAALVLRHDVFWGDPLAGDVWVDLFDALRRSFPHPRGGTLRYDAALIDSGDGVTVDAVYDATRGRSHQRIFPCKGVSGWKHPTLTVGQARQKTVRLQLVGVDGVKARIMQMVAAGAFRFSDRVCDANWFEQFVSERLQVRYSRGVPVKEWHRLPGRRAEVWDCCVYAVAAKSLVQINMDRRADELASAAAPKKQPAVIKSAWLSR